MNKNGFPNFDSLKKRFKDETDKYSNYSGITAVYNNEIGCIDNPDKIKYILIADNPGKKEECKKKYLIGTAGQAARSFFEGNELVKDFSKEVLVLNKTFIYTDRTGGLKSFYNDPEKAELVKESQLFMAELAFDFHRMLNCSLWIVGLSNLSESGIFKGFRDSINEYYENSKDRKLIDKVRCYKHFSYGHFIKDFKENCGSKDLRKLDELGRKYSSERLFNK